MAKEKLGKKLIKMKMKRTYCYILYCALKTEVEDQQKKKEKQERKVSNEKEQRQDKEEKRRDG